MDSLKATQRPRRPVRSACRLDTPQHNVYVVCRAPPFTTAGLPPPGIHHATWEEVCNRFGGTRRRRELLRGLQLVATNLRDAGAWALWLDGSFVTSKPAPGDYDGVWELNQIVDLDKLDPVLLDEDDLANGRLRQKLKYRGELLTGTEGRSGLYFKEFFQITLDGEAKGIVLLDLRTLP
jgi:hypothetical protein